MELSIAQREVAQHRDGPMLVLAGPGSGKTHTLCHHILYLIQVQKVLPEHILVVTFNKSAAKDMNQRFLHLCHQKQTNLYPVRFGTIHSLGYEILMEDKTYSEMTILSETDKAHVMRRLFYQKFTQEHVSEPNEQLLIQFYQEYKQKNHYLDYDDLITKSYHLLQENHMLLQKFRDRYHYILIDEFQDTSFIQFELLSIIAAPKNNMMAVGDDDQSIYGFRGAQASIFQEFCNRYANHKMILLDYNFRSTDEIIRISQISIQQNKERIKKEIKGKGKHNEKPQVIKYNTNKEQAEGIFKDIRYRINQGVLPYDIAVLFRTQNQVEQFQQQLRILEKRNDKQIAFKADFFGLCDLSSYVRIIKKEGTMSDIIRIMNHPERNLRRVYLDSDITSFSKWKELCKACKQEGQYNAIQKLESQFIRLRRMSPFLGIQYLFFAMGYKEFAESKMIEQGNRKEDFQLFENEMMNLAKNETDWNHFYHKLNEYRSTRQNRSEICCMTMHKAKGLEFDTVYLPSLEKGVMPNKKATTDKAMEEERRLFYVAMTRAKNHLVMSYTNEKSQFLKELGE